MTKKTKYLFALSFLYGKITFCQKTYLKKLSLYYCICATAFSRDSCQVIGNAGIKQTDALVLWTTYFDPKYLAIKYAF